MIQSSYFRDNFYAFTMSYYDSQLFLLKYFSYHSIHVEPGTGYLFDLPISVSFLTICGTENFKTTLLVSFYFEKFF